MSSETTYMNNVEMIEIKDKTKGVFSLASDIFEVNRNGYVGITYTLNDENKKVPQCAYRFPHYPHHFLTKFILDLMKIGNNNYTIFKMVEDKTEACVMYETCEGDLIPVPTHTVRFIMKDITEERTRHAIKYKALVEQLD